MSGAGELGHALHDVTIVDGDAPDAPPGLKIVEARWRSEQERLALVQPELHVWYVTGTGAKFMLFEMPRRAANRPEWCGLALLEDGRVARVSWGDEVVRWYPPRSWFSRLLARSWAAVVGLFARRRRGLEGLT